MPEVLRAESAADFLAMLPSLAGFTPRNSLVCVAFQGRRTTPGVLRVDLPERRRESDYRKLVSVLVSMVSRIPDADRIDPVVYTDRSFEEERGIPWLDLARSLKRGFENAGFRVGAALCVASDGWGSYLERAHRAVGHPLAEIESSPLRTRAREASGRDVGDVLEGAEVDDADDAARAEFTQIRRALRAELNADETPLLDELETRADPEPLTWIEYCLESHGSLDSAALAWLSLIVETPRYRDQAALQIGFGRAVGLIAEWVNDDLFDQAEQSGRTLDEVAEQEGSSTRGKAGAIANLLMGRSTMRPLVPRVEAGIHLVRGIVALTPDEARPGPLCLLAWLHWSLGHGSVAGAMIDRALAIDPNHSMALLLDALLGSGMLPEWAFAHEG